MTDTQLASYYAKVRKDAAILSRLAHTENEAELVQGIIDDASERGFALTADQVKSGLSDLGALAKEAAEGDELADFELELVSGGVESAWEQWERAKRENRPCR